MNIQCFPCGCVVLINFFSFFFLLQFRFGAYSFTGRPHILFSSLHFVCVILTYTLHLAFKSTEKVIGRCNKMHFIDRDIRTMMTVLYDDDESIQKYRWYGRDQIIHSGEGALRQNETQYEKSRGEGAPLDRALPRGPEPMASFASRMTRHLVGTLTEPTIWKQRRSSVLAHESYWFMVILALLSSVGHNIPPYLGNLAIFRQDLDGVVLRSKRWSTPANIAQFRHCTIGLGMSKVTLRKSLPRDGQAAEFLLFLYISDHTNSKS